MFAYQAAVYWYDTLRRLLKTYRRRVFCKICYVCSLFNECRAITKCRHMRIFLRFFDCQGTGFAVAAAKKAYTSSELPPPAARMKQELIQCHELKNTANDVFRCEISDFTKIVCSAGIIYTYPYINF